MSRRLMVSPHFVNQRRIVIARTRSHLDTGHMGRKVCASRTAMQLGEAHGMQRKRAAR
jgi:hypothetical protein